MGIMHEHGVVCNRVSLHTPWAGVTQHSDRWKLATNEIVEPSLNIDAPTSNASCCGSYGIGTCDREVPNEVHQSWVLHRRLLHQLVSVPQWPPPEGCILSFPNVFRLTPAFDAHRARQEPLLLMLATALKLPATPILHTWVPSDVRVGDTARPCIDEGGSYGFRDPRDLLNEMVTASASFHIEQIEYKFVALNRIQILGIENITDDVVGVPVANQVDKMDDVFKLARDIGRAVAPTKRAPVVPRRGGVVPDESRKRRRRASDERDIDMADALGHAGGDGQHVAGVDERHDEGGCSGDDVGDNDERGDVNQAALGGDETPRADEGGCGSDEDGVARRGPSEGFASSSGLASSSGPLASISSSTRVMRGLV